MQQKIPGLLLFVLLNLPAPPCAAASNLPFSKVVLVSVGKPWNEAQNYCRSEHTDLVTIKSESDADNLASFKGWIGLKRRENGVWKWSRGDEMPSYYDEDFLEQVNVPDGDDCVYMSDKDWDNKHCDESHPFLCVDERLILVREKKTWEDALVHCRKLPAAENTQHLYTLESLSEQKNVHLDRKTIRQGAETEEVWVALRFLAGEWMWLSREKQVSSYLPQCPAQQQFCGALVRDETQWRTQNCAEKRNFICGPRR